MCDEMVPSLVLEAQGALGEILPKYPSRSFPTWNQNGEQVLGLWWEPPPPTMAPRTASSQSLSGVGRSVLFGLLGLDGCCGNHTPACRAAQVALAPGWRLHLTRPP